MNKTTAMFPLITLLLQSISPATQADWTFDSFTSGNLKHHIARSNTTADGQTLELFCTSYDAQMTIAVYLPQQNQRKKVNSHLNIRIDQGRHWSIPATAHTMSLVSRQTLSPELLSDLKTGNRVHISYQLGNNRKKTFPFNLNASGKALARLEKQCTASS